MGANLPCDRSKPRLWTKSARIIVQKTTLLPPCRGTQPLKTNFNENPNIIICLLLAVRIWPLFSTIGHAVNAFLFTACDGHTCLDTGFVRGKSVRQHLSHPPTLEVVVGSQALICFGLFEVTSFAAHKVTNYVCHRHFRPMLDVVHPRRDAMGVGV